jgi:hypothetical protein
MVIEGGYSPTGAGAGSAGVVSVAGAVTAAVSVGFSSFLAFFLLRKPFNLALRSVNAFGARRTKAVSRRTQTQDYQRRLLGALDIFIDFIFYGY